jgi:hypothetical protein
VRHAHIPGESSGKSQNLWQHRQNTADHHDEEPLLIRLMNCDASGPSSDTSIVKYRSPAYEFPAHTPAEVPVVAILKLSEPLHHATLQATANIEKQCDGLGTWPCSRVYVYFGSWASPSRRGIDVSASQYSSHDYILAHSKSHILLA